MTRQIIGYFVSGISSLLLLFSPALVWADTTPTTDTPTTTSTCPAVNGTTAPTGASASTFTYNAKTCLWENNYYTWDPTTKIYTPKFSTIFVYNPADGNWEYTNWVFNAAAGKYEPVIVIKPISVAPTTSSGQSSTTTNAGTSSSPSGNSSISGTGVDSTNGVKSSSQNNVLINQNLDGSLNNSISQSAGSGNVSVIGNTTVGNAASGNAVDVSNIINFLQSTINLQPADGFMTFTANINGNVTGDLLLDPSQLANIGSGSSSGINSQTNNNLTVNNNTNSAINNDLNLGATSGNVNVTQNTLAGNAASGSANTVADIVNVINSAIGAGKSFVGVININGNLNGDILLPPNFLDQLIASGAPSSTVQLTQQQTNTLNATFNNSSAINNNVNLSAVSGSVNSIGNTQTGSAASGSATTNLTVFNLTGSQVIGANSLMVFVNVLGKWVGLIMDAPAGSSSAALCGGNCQVSSVINNNANINSNTNNIINNNINLTSKSGDVNASQNTVVGNLTSGNASSSANIANFINNQFSLSDWFGLLFINVFGTWNGSFGINTASGNIFNPPSAPKGHLIYKSGAPSQVKVFQFLPGGIGGVNSHSVLVAKSSSSGQSSSGQTSGTQNEGYIVGTNTGPKTPASAGGNNDGINWLAPALGSFAFLLIMTIGSLVEQIGKFRDKLAIRRIVLRNNPARKRAWLRFTIF